MLPDSWLGRCRQSLSWELDHETFDQESFADATTPEPSSP